MRKYGRTNWKTTIMSLIMPFHYFVNRPKSVKNSVKPLKMEFKRLSAVLLVDSEVLRAS